MAQKISTYTTKRSFETYSTDRFVFFKSIAIPPALRFTSQNSPLGLFCLLIPPALRFRSLHSIIITFIFLSGIFSCSEPEIKLNRADRKSIDTLVNNQLDTISPTLDSLCIVNKKVIIKNAVDSIIKERQKQEERLRLNVEGN